MTNISVIENKIASVKKYLTYVKEYQKYSLEEIEDNFERKGSVERYLYLTTQATIELAESIISYRGFRKPTSLRENFDVLQENKFIPVELAGKLGDMAKFRNIIAHDYEKVDFGIIYRVMQKDYKDIEEFLKIAEKIK